MTFRNEQGAPRPYVGRVTAPIVWWRQPDHYDWISGYLQARRMTPHTRATVALTAASLGIAPLAMLASPHPPSGPIGLAMAVLAGAGALGGALLFVIRWPTRKQSIAFAITATVSIALGSLAQSNAETAIRACAAFAVIAGYIALFHTAPLMVANVAIALAIGGVAIARLAREVGDVQALSTFVVVIVVTLAVPFGIQMVVLTLGSDLVRADRDPLTGLLTRRAFFRIANRIGETHRARGETMVVAMIDLDRFKQLNDTKGHGTGDDALVAVGRALRACVPDTAVVGRVGGEEFLCVDIGRPMDPKQLGQTICGVIDELPFPITASVGTAVLSNQDRRGMNGKQVIDALVAAADAAMYEAKREGGDQTRHRSLA
jgi:diguanylate cyclase